VGGVRVLVKAEIFYLRANRLWNPHNLLASLCDTGFLFTEVMWPESEANRSPPSTIEVRNTQRCTSSCQTSSECDAQLRTGTDSCLLSAILPHVQPSACNCMPHTVYYIVILLYCCKTFPSVHFHEHQASLSQCELRLSAILYLYLQMVPRRFVTIFVFFTHSCTTKGNLI
jgi:hypothetical protein